MSGPIGDPVVRELILEAARKYQLQPGETDSERDYGATLLVSYMAGVLAGDKELADALCNVVGLPTEREYSFADGATPPDTYTTPLPVVEVDIDAIHRKATP